MKTWFQVALLAVGLSSAAALAEPDTFGLGSGRDGPLVVTEAGKVINRYTQVKAPAVPGDGVLLVDGTEGFGAGDLVMVLQVTGLVPEPRPGLSGPLELSQDPVGRWELARLAAVGDESLTLSAPLVHSYAARVTQVIRVPEYTDVRVQRGASLRVVPWNGVTGGVVMFLATGTLHNDGEITATGAGFRGGRYVPDSADPVVCSSMSVDARPGAQKGEGLAITQYGPTKTGREMVSNGGGGGVCPMAGGGGGGNGGVGGYGGEGADIGERDENLGGQGGEKLVYSLRDHLSFGGGGGSGHGEDWSGPPGGAGGGAIFIRASRLLGAGFIVADGEAGGSSSVGGASGGGAGGSISLRLSGDAFCGGVSARGGVGGNASGIISGAGEGGGGGGGRALFRDVFTAECSASVSAGSNGFRAFSHPGMAPDPKDGLIESLVDGVASVLPTGVKITSPAANAVVGTRPTIKICVTDNNGTCSTSATGTPYPYAILLDDVEVKTGNSGTRSWEWQYDLSSPLAAKKYRLDVKVGVTGDSSKNFSDNIEFDVDATEPETSIGSKPASETIERIASFSFSSTATNAKFECALDAPIDSDDEPFQSCTSPKIYTGLKIGAYAFSVRAINSVGNKDSSPASYTWTVITLDTAISSAPPLDTNRRDAEFKFSSAGGKSYECKLDAPGTAKDQPFSACTSPKTYTGLEDGIHTFFVRAVYSGTVDSTPAEHTWTVDTVPPGNTVISLAPPPKTNSRNAVFKFSANGGTGYQCALSKTGTSSSFSACTSPKNYTVPEDASYTFSVLAVDEAGNTGNITKYEWMVDATPPVVLFLSPATGTFVRTTTPSIDGKIDDAFSQVQIFIDAVPVAEVTAGSDGVWSLPSTAELSEGRHEVYVKATNQVGDEGALSATNEFTVDTVPPDTSIKSAPSKNSSSRLAVFEFVSPNADSIGFDCQLNSHPYAPCVPVQFFRELADGKYTLRVRAKDAAGNVDPSPEIYEWFVIVDPPLIPEVMSPGDGDIVHQDELTVSGTAKPWSTVAILINGEVNGVVQTTEEGTWTFKPPAALPPGEYSLTTEASDVAGNRSGTSHVRVFTIVVSLEPLESIGGGLGCASSGAQASPAGLLLAIGLWLVRFRRRGAADQAFRRSRSKMSSS